MKTVKPLTCLLKLSAPMTVRRTPSWWPGSHSSSSSQVQLRHNSVPHESGHTQGPSPNGSEVESLEKLKELTDYGKPLLSYHVQGAEDSQGLVELGLVEVRKGDGGKSIIKATTLGRLLTLGK